MFESVSDELRVSTKSLRTLYKQCSSWLPPWSKQRHKAIRLQIHAAALTAMWAGLQEISDKPRCSVVIESLNFAYESGLMSPVLKSQSKSRESACRLGNTHACPCTKLNNVTVLIYLSITYANYYSLKNNKKSPSLSPVSESECSHCLSPSQVTSPGNKDCNTTQMTESTLSGQFIRYTHCNEPLQR